MDTASARALATMGRCRLIPTTPDGKAVLTRRAGRTPSGTESRTIPTQTWERVPGRSRTIASAPTEARPTELVSPTPPPNPLPEAERGLGGGVLLTRRGPRHRRRD